MATYKEIFGKKIQSLTSDIPAAQGAGQIWYNETSNTFKSSVLVAGTWASGGNVPQTIQGAGGGGIQTAAWIAGGLQYPGDTKDKSWTYNGSTWTAAPNIPTNYFQGGSTGPDTAGLLFDGTNYGPGSATYEWDGSAWTTTGSTTPLGTGSGFISGTGTQTAALGIGGIGDPPPSASSRVLDYNGATWTTGTSTPGGVGGAAGDGPNAATWIGGGSGGPTASFEWDSSSWTASGTIGTGLPQAVQGQGWGPQTAGIIAGGTSSGPTATISQLYDGATWSTGASMSTPRISGSSSTQSAGTQTGFVVGAQPPIHDETEEFTAAAVGIQTVTTS